MGVSESGADVDVAVGERMRRHREVLGLTQEVLAEKSGVSVRAISNIERGLTRRPRAATLRQLTDALLLTEGAGEYRAAVSLGTVDRGGFLEQVAALFRSITGDNLDRPSTLIVPLGDSRGITTEARIIHGVAAFPLPDQRPSLAGKEVVIICLPLTFCRFFCPSRARPKSVNAAVTKTAVPSSPRQFPVAV